MSITLHSFGYMPKNPLWHIEREFHDFNEMIIPLSGRFNVRGDNGFKKTASAGDILFYPKRTGHGEQTDSSNPVELIYIQFYGETEIPLCFVFDIEGRIRLLGKWLLQSRHTLHKNPAAIQDAFFTAVLEEFRRISSTPQGDMMVERIRSFAIENIDRQVTVNKLADIAGLSLSHFIKVYSKLTGNSPMDDIRRIKINEAKLHLTNSTYPLKTIATMTGLGDPQSFSKVFRKYTGMTPGQWRGMKQGRD